MFWQDVKDIFKDCKNRNLIFTASVTGPSRSLVGVSLPHLLFDMYLRIIYRLLRL